MNGRDPYFETAPLIQYFIAAVLVGTLACWPMFLGGAVFVFFDTSSYLTNGAAISEVLAGFFDAAPTGEPSGEPSGEAENGPDRGRSIRSVVYSAFAYFGAFTPLGPMGPVLAQSILMSAVAVLFVPASVMRQPLLIGLGLIGLLLLTPWPFYASLFMPDLLTVAVILGAMVLIRGTNARGLWVSGIAMTFAVSSHYGNMPLAFGLLTIVGVWLLLSRRLTLAIIAALTLPLITSATVNVAAGLIAFEEASVAPRRLPILLARSLEDGPARWHLAENCDLYDYEICTALETLPDNVGEALWSEGGLAWISSAEVLNQIRAEERIILWRAFLDYPGRQTWSLIRNAALQSVRFGLSDVSVGEVTLSPANAVGVDVKSDQYRALFDGLEWLHFVVVIGAALYLLAALRSKDRPFDHHRSVIVILLLGLMLNAIIFGGLSAPVDRYQGRIIWLVPFLATLIFAAKRARDDRS